jgi:hypothetical protein
MPLYAVRWENGDVSFVVAEDIDDAVIKLDEVGDANGHPIKELGDDFMLHLRLDHDTGELQFESFGEVSEREIMEFAYPILYAQEGRPSKDAILQELKRVKQHVTKEHPIYEKFKFRV